MTRRLEVVHSTFDAHEPDEWYDGTIVEIMDTEGQFGPQFKWIIELDDDEPLDDGSARESWAYCSQKLTPRSKLYGWATALGWDPDSGTLDVDKIEGRRCSVMFESYKGTDSDGNVVDREKIVKIRKAREAKDGSRVRKARQAAPSAKTVADYGPDEEPF
jgi:hypothetical protein